MRNTNKAMVLTFAERCKNILAGNWQAHLHTIKADAKGSKEEIHSSKVKYLFKRGKPYVWIQDSDLHNRNTIIDERGSLSVASPIPGPVMSLLKSLRKFPVRVALIGDVIPLTNEKAQLAIETLRDTVVSEHKTVSGASYPVSGILSSSGISCKFRSENLLDLLDGSDNYMIYKFHIRSCSYIDGNGGNHEVDLNELELNKADKIAPFSESLIDGINQSPARRRALMLFCFVYLNANARDALMLTVDSKGFDVLAKVPGVTSKDGFGQYEWREVRFTFKQEASDIEAFCRLLVEMEEEALQNVSTYSGLG